MTLYSFLMAVKEEDCSAVASFCCCGFGFGKPVCFRCPRFGFVCDDDYCTTTTGMISEFGVCGLWAGQDKTYMPWSSASSESIWPNDCTTSSLQTVPVTCTGVGPRSESNHECSPAPKTSELYFGTAGFTRLGKTTTHRRTSEQNCTQIYAALSFGYGEDIQTHDKVPK